MILKNKVLSIQNNKIFGKLKNLYSKLMAKEQVDTTDPLYNISQAANNAAIAAKNASDAATSAANNAAIAAKAAADSATAIAIVATDTSWMKKSLSGIEEKLNEMDKAFVTAAQHTEVLKRIDDHEIRINTLETEKTRSTVLLTIGGGILSILLSLLIWHLVGK